MNWLALGPGAALALWAALGGVAIWIYLHHRRPLHRRVSTLRFWASVQPVSQPRKRRLREPWALLAQLLFLLLLIFALANPRLGVNYEGRSVVMVMDTSIWAQARPAGESPWIDLVHREAQRMLNSLPAGDRVLLLPAEPDAPPILPFTTDRNALRRAVAESRVSSGTADIPRALEMGKAALAASRRGLLVYVGPGMVDGQQEISLETFRRSLDSTSESVPSNGEAPQFIVSVVGNVPIENRGITRLSLRRDAAQPDRWHLLTQLKNYSDAKANIAVKLSVNGQALGERAVSLGPNEVGNEENQFIWSKGGLLQAEISPPDALDADNRAVVSLPTFRVIHATVFGSSTPLAKDLLALFAGNPYLRAELVAPGSAPATPADVAVYQGSSQPLDSPPNSIWFLSGRPGGTPHPLRVIGWNLQHPVTRWVRTHDVSVRNPATIDIGPGDTVLASTEGSPAAPLIVARERNGRRSLIVGFDPHDSNFVLQSAFPLLMAGGIEWLTHSVDESANSLSTGELDLPGPVTRITAPSGMDVPFARKGSEMHLLATETGQYRVMTPSGETHVSINTPLLPSQRMVPSTSETAAVGFEPFERSAFDFWRWLVVAGSVVLWLEWWLYYTSRENRRIAEIQETPAEGGLIGTNRQTDKAWERSSERDVNFVGKGAE